MSVFPEFSFPFNDLDDADFNLAIYEMQNGPVRYDADRLASLSFNPLLHNIRTNLARSFDLDPDINLRDLFSDDCEYFSLTFLTICLYFPFISTPQSQHLMKLFLFEM